MFISQREHNFLAWQDLNYPVTSFIAVSPAPSTMLYPYWALTKHLLNAITNAEWLISMNFFKFLF